MRLGWPFRGGAETDEAAAPADGADDPLVYLTTAPNEPMAGYWADVLTEAGIRHLVKHGGAGIGAWGSAATLEHELWVLRSQFAEAEALVRDLGEPEDDPAT